ncbi:hypothetical protein JCM3766R1_000321 [Sporobolomyces carnicolor]
MNCEQSSCRDDTANAVALSHSTADQKTPSRPADGSSEAGDVDGIAIRNTTAPREVCGPDGSETVTPASQTKPLSSELNVAANGLSYSYPPPPGQSLAAANSDAATTPASLPYPAITPHLTRAPVEILTKDPALGRGVFASQDIAAGTVVEISPVLVLGEKEYRGFDPKQQEGTEELRGVEASQLRGYVFTWGKNGDMAVALGLGSLFNHSRSPNVSYEIKQSEYTIHYRAAKPIKSGEELFIFYGHSVRFEGDPVPVADSDNAAEDEWGGLGTLQGEEEEEVGETPAGVFDESISPRLASIRQLEDAPLQARDSEIIGFDEPKFPFRKITEIIDPEDAELTTMPCFAIDMPARHSALVFQFVRKHTSRKFNELGHLKRVRPIEPPRRDEQASDATQDDQVEPTTEAPTRKGTLAADAPVSILLFPTASAPPNLAELLESSPLKDALSPDPIPPMYTVDVPAQPAHTEQQAQEWNKVWPVTLVHIREGPKATMKKKGWERAKMEWIEREMRKVWAKAKEAGQRGEHPIACHVTDSWCPGYHSSVRPPATLVHAFDTRTSTTNCLAHAAANAIDAVAALDLHRARPELSPDAVDPPYVLTGLTVFTSHEPCLMCAMSLLHSRISQLYYVKTAPGSGGCGSLYKVHEDGGLNHRYEVWEWIDDDGKGAPTLGRGIRELEIDP